MVMMLSNGPMSEKDVLQQRRRDNLKAWMDAHCKGNVAELIRRAKRQDKSSSHLREVLSGKKSFGEKLARPLELALGMDPGYLDRPAGKTVVELKRKWPFDTIRPSELEDLDPDFKMRIEDTIRGMLMGFAGGGPRDGSKKKRAGTASGNS